MSKSSGICWGILEEFVWTCWDSVGDEWGSTGWECISNQENLLKNSRKTYLRIEWEFKPVYLSVGSEFENLATSGVIVESGFNNLKRASRSMLTQVCF